MLSGVGTDSRKSAYSDSVDLVRIRNELLQNLEMFWQALARDGVAWELRKGMLFAQWLREGKVDNTDPPPAGWYLHAQGSDLCIKVC